MRWLAALAAPVLIGAAPTDAPPELDLVLKPAGNLLDVRMTMATPGFKAGDPVVRLPLILVGIPSARYDGDALQAHDDAGSLPLAQDEEPPTPQGTYRRWKAVRDSIGPVVIHFAAPPRAVTAATNNGPLFDLRAENGGFIGAGVGFMATPARPGSYRVKLHWDVPAGWRGVWSLGTGDVDTVAPADVLAFSYYAVGPLKSEPATPGPGFGLYWLTDPPFDTAALGDRIHRLYDAMARFFDDHNASYRVFIRRNPYHGIGGTALAHSFMLGYNPADKPTLDKLQGYVSHEMVHNWPAMQGEHGDTAWYSEGTAEFYSLMLSYRAGLLTTDQFLELLNRKAFDYYTNPFRDLSNPEAAKRFWTDPTAQTVPYGRGFLYLLRTDAAIRARSSGKRSLDDVVRALYARQKAGQSYGIADWLGLVGDEIGKDEAKRDYDAMVAGTILVAPARRFAPCFIAERRDERIFELGFARASLGERKIRGLESDSEAARAGVRDGDVVVAVSDLAEIRSDPTKPMTLTLRRGDRTMAISYPPLGRSVEAWRWHRDPKALTARCTF